MIIKIEKKYINANGNIITITSKDITHTYQFTVSTGKLYTINGLLIACSKTTKDLICEIDESILKEYENKIISKYEFLLRHYLKYGGNISCLKTH